MKPRDYLPDGNSLYKLKQDDDECKEFPRWAKISSTTINDTGQALRRCCANQSSAVGISPRVEACHSYWFSCVLWQFVPSPADVHDFMINLTKDVAK